MSSSQSSPQPKKKIPMLGKLAVGGLAGVVGVSSTFPLDIVKTNLQSSNSFKGPIHCFRTLLARDGVRGLFRGLPPTLIGVIPEKAIKLAVNDYLREAFDPEDTGVLPMHKQILAGAGAGFCQVIATNPMEIVKIRIQTQDRLPLAERKSAVEVVKQLGIRGLYKGTSACLLRDVPYAIVFFPTYATLRDTWADENGHTSMPAIVTAGCAAGAFAAAIATPPDVIKTKRQMIGADYKGTIDCFQKVYAAEGASALFKGVVPRMMVQAPLFGITLLAFEVQKAYMEKN
ncbi:Mitochondrial Carrier (MC) Family [Thraustotheca clavata]|uniref:Mitochondrial Carrier (MC) Family n=1 Tax=Thraustotheca clavata TaxID=74557 RepID=A0A1V9ZCH4_9STRA|nr:Mitochondrial Carrier (MC) Family [Thraustotheca clavata]